MPRMDGAWSPAADRAHAGALARFPLDAVGSYNHCVLDSRHQLLYASDSLTWLTERISHRCDLTQTRTERTVVDRR